MNQEDKSKIKVGILKETPFLPVSKSTLRAMDIAEKALIEEGYDVVKFDITEDEWGLKSMEVTYHRLNERIKTTKLWQKN